MAVFCPSKLIQQVVIAHPNTAVPRRGTSQQIDVLYQPAKPVRP